LRGQDQVPAEKQGALTEIANRLGNLQILTAPENAQKSSNDFSEWIKTRGESFYERQFIPLDETFWEVSEFEKFVSAREALISERLQSLFSTQREF